MKPLTHFKNYKSNDYLHLDKKVSIKHVYKCIQDPQYISKHAFLPFIRYSLKLNKYTFREGHNNKSIKKLKLNKDFNQGHYKKIKEKSRDINYAAHLDSFIYKYYGELLNEAYNDYAIKNGFDHCSTAYRNNKKGKSNIDYAKEVFKFLLKHDNAAIIALDFTPYFDHISHSHLKRCIKEVLNVNELPKDYYNVFKSITKYRYIDKEKLDQYILNGLPEYKLKEIVKAQKNYQYMDIKTFRKLVKNGELTVKSNPTKNSGIPQGSGLSAVCSNIRMIEFDKEMNNWMLSVNGMYRRYCDDMIFIIPNVANEQLEQFEQVIYEHLDYEDDLTVQKEKTIVLNYKDKKMFTKKKERSKLDYLGFTFDGQVIKLREKSLFKYYTRAYRKTKVISKAQLKFGRKAYMKDLYRLYTHLDAKKGNNINFISYAEKAQRLFEDLPVNVEIRNQTKRHWYKLHKRLERNKKKIIDKLLEGSSI